MFWIKKAEIALKDNAKKIVLERVSLFGRRQQVKFIETALPHNHSSQDNIISITQRRRGWRFRYKYPLRTTYYKKNENGRWVQIGTVFP